MGIQEGSDETGRHFFRNFGKYLWAGLREFLNTVTPGLGSTVNALTTDTIDEDAKAWVQNLKEKGIIDSETASFLADEAEKIGSLGGLWFAFIRFSLIMREMGLSLDMHNIKSQYGMLSQLTPHPADKDSLIRAMIIDPSRVNENRTQLHRHGFDDDQIDNMILSYYQVQDEDTIKQLYLRGFIKKDKMYEKMRELGYTDTRIGETIQTWELLPNINDLMVMTFRGAFDPRSKEKWPWAFNVPPQFLAEGQKLGLTAEWAEKYWYMHWTQPGIREMFEMMHRGAMTEDELDFSMFTQGYSQYWTSKIKEITYNPYTRVDVRRMHDLDILSTDELVKAYTDLGYDTERAINMAKFTVKYNASHEQTLTRASILSSYEDGLISRADAKTLLEKDDYSSDIAEYYLTKSDYDKAKNIQDLHFTNIRERYLNSQVSKTWVNEQLTAMDMPANEITATLENWDLLRYKYERIPSLSDLLEFYKKGLISEANFNAYMKQHGYDDGSILLYKSAIDLPDYQPGRLPSKTDLENFFKAGVITEKQWWGEMEKHGYKYDYISWYLKLMYTSK